ncbi:MAG: undecaprenyl-diphosphate phosphatase [Oscillospiraceae bacterium]|jgi:undecaprenyl-diphosphatase|nr:undecaprenyl-diphosphate phosphatase [Oscillospiraceae bacterium]
MTAFFAILLALIQGLTEFLPVSSSGHLSLAQALFGKFGVSGFDDTDFFYNILLHGGTLIAVCVYYRKDVANLFLHPNRNGKLWLMGIAACLPLVAVPLFDLDDYVKVVSSSTLAIGILLIFTGIMLKISDAAISYGKTEREAKWYDPFVIGIAQLIAVLPGISRSGATISAGLLRGFTREFATKFSFLLSIPTILAGLALETKDALESGTFTFQAVYVPGIIVAAVSGYCAVMFVNRVMKRGRFGGFAVYCFSAGIFGVILSFI